VKNKIGKSGEEYVAKYLAKNFGYKIVDTNYKCGKFGEIDIIAKDGNRIVFVEVKTRSSDYFMEISETIDIRKKHALMQAANYYTLQNNLQNASYRIDLATYNTSTQKVEYFEDVLN
jgi:putative endonuclease